MSVRAVSVDVHNISGSVMGLLLPTSVVVNCLLDLIGQLAEVGGQSEARGSERKVQY